PREPETGPEPIVPAPSSIAELSSGVPAFAVGARYRIERTLGQGGMGQVFAARDEKLGRPVAIKFLNPGMHDDHQFARFEQEARAAGSINHPNILTVYDVVATAGGPCIISELLE